MVRKDMLIKHSVLISAISSFAVLQVICTCRTRVGSKVFANSLEGLHASKIPSSCRENACVTDNLPAITEESQCSCIQMLQLPGVFSWFPSRSLQRFVIEKQPPIIYLWTMRNNSKVNFNCTHCRKSRFWVRLRSPNWMGSPHAMRQLKYHL